MKAIIFVAHGSKKNQSNQEFITLADEVSRLDNTYDLKSAAFLELATPNITEVIRDFIDQGANEITLYPYFLNSGKHVAIDLPNEIEHLQKEYPSIKFKLLDHFGKSQRIVEIILDDIK